MAYRLSRPATVLLAAAALVTAGAGTLEAQELRGRVTVEGGAGQPVEGALVALFPAAALAADRSTASVAAAFTGADGSYVLRAPATGDYAVRIDRIGFESWTSEPYSLGAGEVVSAMFTLPIRPVRLAQIDVSVVRSCWDDSRDAPAIEVVREEARKALEATRVAERERLFRFNSVIVDRHLATGRLGQLSVSTIALENVIETPFRSRPAAELSERGYIQARQHLVLRARRLRPPVARVRARPLLRARARRTRRPRVRRPHVRAPRRAAAVGHLGRLLARRGDGGARARRVPVREHPVRRRGRRPDRRPDRVRAGAERGVRRSRLVHPHAAARRARGLGALPDPGVHRVWRRAARCPRRGIGRAHPLASRGGDRGADRGSDPGRPARGRDGDARSAARLRHRALQRPGRRVRVRRA